MLKKEDIELRALKETDLKEINIWHNDLNLKSLTGGAKYPISKVIDEKWLDRIMNDTNNTSIYFAIEVKSVFIGLLNLESINWINRTASIGILIGNTKNRGQGYGKKSLKLLIYYAFNVLNLNKLKSFIYSYNKSSLSLFKSCGFQEEGLLKEEIFNNGQYEDEYIFSITRNKYNNIIYRAQK